MINFQTQIENDRVLNNLNELCLRLSGYQMTQIGELMADNKMYIMDNAWETFEKIYIRLYKEDPKQNEKMTLEMIDTMKNLLGADIGENIANEETEIQELDLLATTDPSQWTSKQERKKAEKLSASSDTTASIFTPYNEETNKELVGLLKNKTIWDEFFKETNRKYDYHKYDKWLAEVYEPSVVQQKATPAVAGIPATESLMTGTLE